MLSPRDRLLNALDALTFDAPKSFTGQCHNFSFRFRKTGPNTLSIRAERHTYTLDKDGDETIVTDSYDLGLDNIPTGNC